MAALVRIFDDLPENTPGPAIELGQLLDLLAPQGTRLVWSILELEGRAEGPFPDGRTMLELEQAANESPIGLVVTWDELRTYARGFKDIINGTFVGCQDAAALPQIGPGVDIYAPSELVVEAVDTTYWQVYARDEQILRRLQSAFRRVEVLSVPRV